MRTRILGVLAFLGAMAIAPFAAAQTISAPLQVSTGDVFTVNVAYTQSMDIQGEDFSATMTQVYAVHVLDAENRLWRFMPISLAYDLPEMPSLEAQAAEVNWPAMSDMLSAMLRIATDVGFDCRVDEHGRCVEMTNWPFWSARVENLVLAFDGMARMIPENILGEEDAYYPEPAPPEARGAKNETTEATVEMPATSGGTPSWETLRVPVLRGVARLIDGVDSRDAAASMAGMYLPAFVQGRTLTRRETVAFTDEYEMPFGAPPLRYNGTLRLDRIDRAANTAIVTRRSTLDQESVRASFTSMTEFVSDALVTPLAAHFPEGDTPPDTAALVQLFNSMVTDFSYDETTRGVIDLSTGMARETTTDYTVTLAIVGSDEPLRTTGRIITTVTRAAPEMPRLPRD